MDGKKFIHIDMDCLFAAIEMRENPALCGIPLVVGGSAAQRGVVSTANYVARQFGIHSAMPTATALRRCPHLTVLPVRMALYARVGTQIRAILARYTAHIEPVSLDEAYLDVTENTPFQGSAFLLAQDMRRAIYAETGLTASADVSGVKFLAKIASDMHKPDGIFCIPPQRVQDFLRQLPAFSSLRVRGLMTLALFSSAAPRVRQCFVRLRTLRDELRQSAPPGVGLDELSMGMSGDFEIAIEEGATVVRVGQAIFGARPMPDSHYWPGEARAAVPQSAA